MAGPMDEPERFDEFVLALTEAQPRLYAFVYKRLLNVELARDVLQETNLVLWRRASEFQPGTHFMAWAYRIAHFQILALRQKQAREKLVFSDELLQLLVEEEADASEVKQDRLAALQHCLDQAGEQPRALIAKRYAEGMGVQEIAERIGKTANAVSRSLYRIRLALMECVERVRAGSERGGEVTR
jgi:RNA polymerase sigma-70 factor (ECF subfamily)